MKILEKTFLTIVSILILMLLFFLTFIAPAYEGSESNINKINNEQFSISQDLHLSKSGSKLKIQNINKANYVYSIDSEYKIENDNIILDKGFYILDFYEVTKPFKVSGYNFEFIIDKPTNIYINTKNKYLNSFYLTNTKQNISLTSVNKNNQKNINKIVLYPNSYLLFDPTKISFYTDIDIQRLKQVFLLDFYNGEKNINNLEFVKNTKFENILKFIEKNKGGKSLLFLQKYNKPLSLEEILLINEDEFRLLKIQNLFRLNKINKSSEGIENFKNKGFYYFPGEKYINSYYSLFINKEKKEIYLKNIILKKVFNLLSEKKLNKIKTSEILKDLEEIKSLNINQFNNIKTDINNIYSIVLTGEYKNIGAIENIAYLSGKINNSNTKINSLSLLELRNIIYKNVYINTSGYFQSLYLFINNLQKEQENLNYSYLLNYLENFLINNYDNKNIINIYKIYTNVADKYYSSSDEKIIQTGLNVNYEIFENIISTLKNGFFKEKRNSRNLLEHLDKQILTTKDFVILKNTNSEIINFYNKNKKYLNSQDINKKLIQNYQDSIDSLEEYYLAIENYEIYVEKFGPIYEKSNTEEINEDNKLSIKKAEDYLKNFLGVNIVSGNTKIELKKSDFCNNVKSDSEDFICYYISNLYIGSIKISFILSPYRGNKISDITKIENGKETKIDAIYDLDEIQQVSEDDYDKRDLFKNFFVDNFNKKQEIISEEIQDEVCSFEGETSSQISRFIRNELLNGDFNNIRKTGFITIDYNNLKIDIIDNKYNIFIVCSNINSKIEGDKYNDFKYDFESEYIYDKIHSFKNLKLKLLNKENPRYKYYFDDQEILIEEEIKVDDLEKYITKMNKEVLDMKKNYSLISKFFKKIKLKYLKGKIEYSFSFLTQEIKILQQNKNFDLIYKGITYSNLDFENLTIYLNNIKQGKKLEQK